MSLLVPELTNGRCSEQICLLRGLPLPKVWTWITLRFVTPELAGAISCGEWKMLKNCWLCANCLMWGEKHVFIGYFLLLQWYIRNGLFTFCWLLECMSVPHATASRLLTAAVWNVWEYFFFFFLFPSNFKKLFVWRIHMFWFSIGNNYI